MEQITGEIESMRKDRKGIKVNGEWYSAYASSQLSGVEWKDVVTFGVQRTEKNGQVYMNIKGDAKKSGGGGGSSSGAPTPSASPAVVAAASAWPQPVDARSRSIIRQNSVTNAVNFAKTFMVDVGATPEDVVRIARVFESYCTGEVDNTDAKPFSDDDIPM